jgi:hypothetical protein
MNNSDTMELYNKVGTQEKEAFSGIQGVLFYRTRFCS